MRIVLAMIGLIVLLSGCTSAPAPAPAPTPPPIAGLRPTSSPAVRYTTDQLIQIDLATIGFAEWYLARLAGACDTIASQSTTPEMRRQALRLKAVQGSSVYAIVSGPNPLVQVLDFAALLNLTHRKWVDEGLAQKVFGANASVLIEALDDAMKRGHTNALRVVSEQELRAIEVSVAEWRSANPAIQEIEFVRLEDFITELSRSLAPEERDDLLSNLKSAAEGLGETRLLGERALYLTSRLPRIVSWQLEAQIGDALQQARSGQLVDDMSRLTQTAEALQKQTPELMGKLDSLPQKLADSFTGAPEMKQALTQAREAVSQTDGAIKQITALASAIRGVDATLATLSQQVDQINKAYEPAQVARMGREGREIAVREVRSLIFIAAGCIAGLMVLAALLRRLTNRGTAT